MYVIRLPCPNNLELFVTLTNTPPENIENKNVNGSTYITYVCVEELNSNFRNHNAKSYSWLVSQIALNHGLLNCALWNKPQIVVAPYFFFGPGALFCKNVSKQERTTQLFNFSLFFLTKILQHAFHGDLMEPNKQLMALKINRVPGLHSILTLII